MEHSEGFLNWLRANGSQISPKIAIKDYSSEGARLGLSALEDVKKDEILFTIPRGSLLTRKTCRYRETIKKYCARQGWVPLMWSIILEKADKEKSFWKPYFDIVPDWIDLPSTWSEDEQGRRLAGTGLEHLIPETEDQFKKLFLAHKDKFTQTKDLTVNEFNRLFHFAGSLTSAYSFTEDAEKIEDIAIVPLADILNHRTNCNNARLFYGADVLKMVCIRDVSAGEQLFNTYGDLSNSQLFIKYGYVDAENPFNVVHFDLEWLIEEIKAHRGDQAALLLGSERTLDALVDNFYDEIEPTIDAKADFSFEGLKRIFHWLYLLTLPKGTSPKQWKPKREYGTEWIRLNKDVILKILQARIKMYPQDKILNIEQISLGSDGYVHMIIRQSIDMLQGYVDFIQSPGILEAPSQ